jgi:hypothetical protein
MSKKHVMVDLETLSTEPNAVITSIGAVSFNEEGLGEEFYYTVDIQSCLDAGLHISAGTIVWWLNQSQAARAMYSEEQYKHAADLRDALNAFRTWVRSLGSQQFVWGNGADFDNVILTSAYDAFGEGRPWSTWNSRCYRTFKNLHKNVKLERHGVHHNALADAKDQAQHMVDIYNANGAKFE